MISTAWLNADVMCVRPRWQAEAEEKAKLLEKQLEVDRLHVVGHTEDRLVSAETKEQALPSA